ncbi:hypothetical protein [Photobacterium sanguinicancri]|uniref:hypothetical protein n=1 Tax=Photobacterium sanguinicancri TaxID=875932 RepID=UPI0026E352A0|nr:hypothetical protein [Photobacterium sanguinicancri]MDO6498331.1 hypothetical protein [Photobacterium sanguinicancri]
MKIYLSIILCFVSFSVFSGVTCELRNLDVEVGDHGNIYLHGRLNGKDVSWIDICGGVGQSPDCSSKASDRRLSVALAAQASDRILELRFSGLNSCNEYKTYLKVDSIVIKRRN